MTEVILVNENDEVMGSMEKMAAHRKPTLHRAFSVFLFNNHHKILLQQRAPGKYHSGGLWTNTCCSHPHPGEETKVAASRRLKEEMGIETDITKVFDFIYQADFDNGLTEYEYDHVFIGTYNGAIMPDHTEVSSYCFKSIEEIKQDLELKPHMYTAWFKIALPKLEAYLQEREAMVA